MEINRVHFPIIDSTNTWAKQNARKFDVDKITLVTADEQTAGRGRFQRTWKSPSGQNLSATFCFFLSNSNINIGNIPQILAIAASQVMEVLDLSPKLKWPNDIMISGKKVSGILCETLQTNGLLCVVLGIGINVNMSSDVLKSIDRPATSFKAETDKHFDLQDICQNLQKAFVPHLQHYLSEGFSSFLPMYTSRLAMQAGDSIRFNGPQGIVEGQFHSISDDGSLNLVLPSGLTNFLSGEFVV